MSKLISSIPSLAFLSLLLVIVQPTWATPSENNSLRVLPAPAGIKIDGKTDDWDLGSGIYACDDVEKQRDKYGVWLYAMYDENNLYILGRFVDHTPLNNPGQTIADNGFVGDCLQFRTITKLGTPDEKVTHWTCWKGRDGGDILFGQFGKDFKSSIADAKKEGGQQAFTVNADGKGYVQEIAIPWKFLSADGKSPGAGQTFQLTFEPNFTVGAKGRLTIKDLFMANKRPDRVFTFTAVGCWGPATLAEKPGPVPPQSERLADGREFPVTMENGVPVVNWNGLEAVAELPGFKTLKFTMPDDGFISLNIKSADGTVVRQLLNAAPYTKGPHEVKWDGLTNISAHLPGDPVAAGEYSWSGLFHKEIGLKLRGWADNAGSAPWDNGLTTNWGGDEGNPVTVGADETQVYLGWSFAESGSAMLACDLKGNVLWKNKHGGLAGVDAVASDGTTVYALGGGPGIMYKLNAKDGSYLEWAPTIADINLATIGSALPGSPTKANNIAARDGKIYLSFTGANKIVVLDGKDAKVLQTLDAASPSSLQVTADGTIYYVGEGKSVMKINASGASSTLVSGLTDARGMALDKAGNVYIAVGDPDNQIKVYDAQGHPQKAIGRQGGRPLTGKWNPDGMRFLAGIGVTGDGNVWAAESDEYPRRFSCWNPKDGTLVKEFLGPTGYGAGGGSIDPLDPNIMVGQGCEWKMDPKTGLSVCTAVITRDGMGNSRFAVGNGGRLYLVVSPTWAFDQPKTISFYERTGEAEYKLRSKMYFDGSDGNKPPTSTRYWADENGDGQEQPDEFTTVPANVNFSGWYMQLAPDLTFYNKNGQYKVTGFTSAGAPKYDLAHPVEMPIAGGSGGMGSADGKVILYNGDYGADRSVYTAYDIESKKKLWTYPDNFVGVHGSHNATPGEIGMIRGAYDITGVAALPAPIGNIWAIPTNVGEWHLLTADGFYLTHLFQTDQLQVVLPADAVPGADMTEAPSGGGGEDFGGSISCGPDGKLYVQSGHTGFRNLEVTGLETAQAIPGEKISMSDDDVKQAAAMRETEIQGGGGKHTLAIKKSTPTFTGDLAADFKGSDLLAFQKTPESAVKATATWDDQNLYLGWDVGDATPWQNSAKVPEDMYVGGDTVDFQMGTNADAPKDRSTPVAGDFRLSIGNLNGKPTAEIYRLISDKKKPHVFSSGIVHAYPMDFVDELADAKITVNPRGDGYVVEAIIPLASIGLTPSPGLTLHGDFGATHGGAGGTRTKLRTYWANQHTGLVDDAVFEVQIEPKNWGELHFVP